MNKIKNSILGLSAVGCLSTVHAATILPVTILQYDSTTTSALDANDPDTPNDPQPQLAVVASDGAFVLSSSATTFTDDLTFSRTHLEQSTPLLGELAPDDALDLAFSFGDSALDNNSSTVDSPFIGLNFVAAQDLNLTEFSLAVDPNNGPNFNGARDVTLFVSIDGGEFTQFGDAITRSGNALNTNTYTDSVSVLLGQEVEFRAAFSDRGGFSATNLQSFTRVGDIQISAEAVPEPSSAALLGLGGLALIMRRRK